jgi:mRNA interferase HigB
MKISGTSIIEHFCKKHADAEEDFVKWMNFASNAKWKDHDELEADYPSADYVGNKRYVFNIKGNHYRLIVAIVFIVETIEVRFIGTHAEYDKIHDIQNI